MLGSIRGMCRKPDHLAPKLCLFGVKKKSFELKAITQQQSQESLPLVCLKARNLLRLETRPRTLWKNLHSPLL